MLTKGNDIGKSSAEFPYNKVTLYPTDDHWLSSIRLSQNNRWKLAFYHHRQAWQSNIAKVEEQLITRKTIADYSADTFGSIGSLLIGGTVIGAEWMARLNINISEQEFNANQQLAWQKDKVDADESTVGLFINHAWLIDGLTINTGARYDKQKVTQNINLLTSTNIDEYKVDDEFLSLSLSGQYALSTKTQLTLSLANAFRFPTVSELFFSGETPRGNTQGNINLKPEKSLGFQVDISHNVNRKLKLFANIYNYNLDDYIERINLTDDLRTYRNRDNVTLNGFEFTAVWQENSELSSRVSYQKQKAINNQNQTVDDELPEVLKWKVNWFPSVNFLQRFSFETQLVYQFKKDDFGGAEQALPDNFIWHANMQYQLSHTHTLSVSLINLTNNTYYASADEDAALQAERNIALSWQWQFN